MVNSNAFTAWRLFQLNWIPMASTPVFGGVALAVIGIWLAKYLMVPASKAQATPQAALVPALD
jgi:hypothetical protein